MNPALYELLKGAGLEDIVIPRKEFIDEHKHLIKLLNRSNDPALRKEASSQKKELEKMTGGFTKSSGFIRRLMAENKKKHGDYRRPVYPLAEDSTMNKPWKFKYYKIANAEQDGRNKASYGASPFIQKHFGNVRAEQEEDDDDGDNAPPPPPRDEPIRESKRQKEARKRRFKKGEEQPPPPPPPEQPAPSSSSSSSTPMGDILPDEKPEKRKKPIIGVVRAPIPLPRRPVKEEKEEKASEPAVSEKKAPAKPAVSEMKEEKEPAKPAVSEKKKPMGLRLLETLDQAEREEGKEPLFTPQQKIDLLKESKKYISQEQRDKLVKLPSNQYYRVLKLVNKGKMRPTEKGLESMIEWAKK